jgi:hypothetical protein
MIKQMSFLGLVVKDVDAATEFYSRKVCFLASGKADFMAMEKNFAILTNANKCAILSDIDQRQPPAGGLN